MLDITRSVLSLTKSMRFKFNNLAIYINESIIDKYNVDIPQNPREWKYHMNLAGIKHFTNKDVLITIIETRETVKLTKKLMTKYSYTRKELMKNESMYLDLIEQYPEDIDYILGCIYHADMDDIINAEDGDVILYNTTLIDDNENILEYLENYIKNCISRWHINEYNVVQNLYMPSFLGVLYANIPNKLLTIRTNNISTNNVCEYFMKVYFDSRLAIWNDLKYLNKQSVFWLYRNLEYLFKHVGKNSTLQIIVDKIFEANKIGIGTYHLKQSSPDTNHEVDLSLTPYKTDRALLLTVPLNASYDIITDEKHDISNITVQQLIETDPLEGLVDNQLEKATYISKGVKDRVNNTSRGTEQTKILDINIRDIFKVNPVDLLDIAINNWVRLVKENKFLGLIDYTDPNTNGEGNKNRVGTFTEYTEPNSNVSYTLSPLQGLLLLVKLLLRLAGKENVKLTKFHFQGVLYPENTVDEYISGMFAVGHSDHLIRELHEALPSRVTSINSPIDMEEHLKEIILFNKKSWLALSNCENALVSGNIKTYLNKVTLNGDLVLSEEPKTIDELLASHGIVYELKNTYDLNYSIRELVYNFTHIRVDEYEEMRLSMRSYKNLLDKLTSYTTQIIDTVENVDNRATMRSMAPTVLITEQPALAVIDGETIPLEPVVGVLHSTYNDFRDENYTISDHISSPKVYVADTPLMGGYACISSESNIRDDSPVNTIEILDIERYTVSGDEFKDVFLKDLVIDMTMYDKIEGTLNGASGKVAGVAMRSITTGTSPIVYAMNNPPIQQFALSDSGYGISDDKPNNIITVKCLEGYSLVGDNFGDEFFTNAKFNDLVDESEKYTKSKEDSEVPFITISEI